MLAHELRSMALKVSEAKDTEQVQSAVEYLETLSLNHAKRGNFSLHIEIKKLPFNKDILQKTFTILGIKGYACKIENEITAHYSNTDCDCEDFFTMKW